MNDQPRSWEQIFDELFTEPEIAELGQRIGSKLPTIDLRRAIKNVAAIVIGVAASNPRPWREQKRGLEEVADRARKAAAAVRKLGKALDYHLWIHSREELFGAVGWSGPDDLRSIADRIETTLALPAKAAAGMREIPQHEVFAIFVQWIAHLFNYATGQSPSFTYDHYHPSGERYTGSFVELLETVWSKTIQAAKSGGLKIKGPASAVARGKYAQRLMDKT